MKTVATTDCKVDDAVIGKTYLHMHFTYVKVVMVKMF